MTLHEEIETILDEKCYPMNTREIAEKVNNRGNYIKKDGSPVTDFQIHGRTKNYPHLFTRKGTLVGLVKWGYLDNLVQRKRVNLGENNIISKNSHVSKINDVKSSDLEEIRKKYRPNKIHVLFIGESAPAGGTFFYLANSNLYRYTQESYESVYKEECIKGIDFLNFFKNLGCYLEDLCLEPVNNLNNNNRKLKRNEYVNSLTERIRKANPKSIIVVMLSIRENVEESIRLSGIGDIPIYYLPFPSQGNQRRYVEKLINALENLRSNKILK